MHQIALSFNAKTRNQKSLGDVFFHVANEANESLLICYEKDNSLCLADTSIKYAAKIKAFHLTTHLHYGKQIYSIRSTKMAIL